MPLFGSLSKRETLQRSEFKNPRQEKRDIRHFCMGVSAFGTKIQWLNLNPAASLWLAGRNWQNWQQLMLTVGAVTKIEVSFLVLQLFR